MKTVTREELKAKLDRRDDSVLPKVLGEASYRRAHLPDAIRFLDASEATALFPDRSSEIIAYFSSFD
jgi:hypothetical protein